MGICGQPFILARATGATTQHSFQKAVCKVWWGEIWGVDSKTVPKHDNNVESDKVDLELVARKAIQQVSHEFA